MSEVGQPLAGRAAIVTGAATGIGKGIAARLAADGAAVVVNHFAAQKEEAEAVAAGINGAGGSAVALDADISRREEFAALFERSTDRLGRVDILVNNAAVAPLTPIVEASDEQIDAVIAVNVKGTLYGCQLAAEQLADNGRIINISSSTTGLGLPGYGIYDMSKGAIEQLTRILAKELGARGITVNAVSPGATETETYRVGKARTSSPASNGCRPSTDSATSPRSPTSSPSSLATVPAGSPARTSASTAARSSRFTSVAPQARRRPRGRGTRASRHQ